MSAVPLAERMRPQSLDDYIGQHTILGENSGLRKAIQSGNIPSMIFWGLRELEKQPLLKSLLNLSKDLLCIECSQFRS